MFPDGELLDVVAALFQEHFAIGVLIARRLNLDETSQSLHRVDMELDIRDVVDLALLVDHRQHAQNLCQISFGPEFGETTCSSTSLFLGPLSFCRS